MAEWIGVAVGKMHMHKITQAALAEKLGVRRDYLNRILAGKHEPKGIEERVMGAIAAIIAERG